MHVCGIKADESLKSVKSRGLEWHVGLVCIQRRGQSSTSLAMCSLGYTDKPGQKSSINCPAQGRPEST